MKFLPTILSAVLLTLPLAPHAVAESKESSHVHAELAFKGFNVLVGAVSSTEWATKFRTGTYTVLAPTDVAFRDLPKAELDALLADKEKLTALLSKHIIEGRVTLADLKSGKFQTVGGSSVEAKVSGGKVKIGTATVVRPDIQANNGVIHGIDKILQP